jgi:hypothetical protein
VYWLFENSNGYSKLYKKDKGISDENVTIFAKLDMKDKINVIKKVMIGLFLFILAESAADILGSFHFILPSLPKSWELDIDAWKLILLSILINHFISFLIHNVAYKNVIIKKDFDFKNLSFKDGFLLKSIIFELQLQKLLKELRRNILYFIFSPDYFYAVFYKSKLKNRVGITKNLDEYRDKDNKGLMEWDRIKIERKFFVEYSNWFNVCFIIIVTILIIGIWNYHGFIVDILYYFLLFRLLSRSIEIVYAYYKDVVRVDSIIFKRCIKNKTETIYINNWKSSAIRKPARISLACHTLFELVLTFTLLYYFVASISSSNNLPVNTLSLYWEFFVYSLSINIFNFSFTSYPNLLWSILHVAQVFIGVVLIVLSLARYLGLSDEITVRDEEFFIKVEEKKNEIKSNNNK